MFRMTSTHNQNKGTRIHDPFQLVATIDAIAAVKGKENVADAFLGIIKDDKGEFASIPTYEHVLRTLPTRELCDYATINGLPDFQDAVVKSAFAGHVPAGCKTEVLATPGGSGALYVAVTNYVEKGDKYLSADVSWGYSGFGVEHDCECVTYRFFDENYEKFNAEAWKAKTLELIEKQKSLLMIFNTPAHNPSGYNMTVEDWKVVTDTSREICKNPDKKIIIVWDWAYTEYAGTAEETRAFLKNFDNMPQNMLLLVAYSMSKSFLIYGIRSGALIACSPSEDVIEDFIGNCSFTSRSTWSNGSRGAQKALAIVYNNPELLAKVDEERRVLRDMLINRGKIFMKEAKEVGLFCLPHESGFFITAPCKQYAEVVRIMREEQDTFLMPTGGMGIRIAISSCPTKMVYGLAGRIKKCIDDHGFTQER